jgi:hypothetical protein
MAWTGRALPVQADGELTHLYLFDGDLSDERNGPDLTSGGGTVAGGRYVFDANEGLSLLNGLEDVADYSVVIVMEFDEFDGYQKVIDFENLTEDEGLYTYDDYLYFYSESDYGLPGLQPNIDFQLIFTRSGSTGETKAYINGVLQWTFTDTSDYALPSGNLLRFFEDDVTTSQGEAAAGSAACIGIYDGVLEADEVADLGTDGCGRRGSGRPPAPEQRPRPPNIGAGLSGLFNGQPTPLPTAPSAVAPAPAATSPVITPPRTGDGGLVGHGGGAAWAMVAIVSLSAMAGFAWMRRPTS